MPALENKELSSVTSSEETILANDTLDGSSSIPEPTKLKNYKNILAIGIVVILVIGIFFVIRHKFSTWKKTMPNKKDLSEETKKDNQ